MVTNIKMNITFGILQVMAVLILCGIQIVDCQNLKLVTVLFRHADRTPDVATLYPLDPHLNETYYPIGIGQLTNKGKQNAYAFGQQLRKRYDSFLGTDYYPGMLEAVSTHMDRTKATLQLVLAGTFPPRSTYLNWNPILNWQPIPYNYSTFANDMSLTYSYDNCPRYRTLYNKYMESQAGIDLKHTNFELYEYVHRNTGVNFTNPINIWGVYACLLSQAEWGLKLPNWTDTVFPDVLEKATVEVMRTHVATTELKQLSGGFIIKRIINNMLAKIKDTPVSDKTKLILYSAHDVNIIYMSSVLGQAINRPVPYGSYYIIELVESEGIDCVQIYTNNYTTQEITPVKVPGCEVLCPLQDFIRLLKKYIPEDNACNL